MRWTKNRCEIAEIDELNEDEVQAMANQKLSDLEDIEDKVGLTLTSLFKALENGIYYRHLNLDGTYDEEIYFEEPEHLSIGLNGLICAYTDYYDDDLRYEYSYKDYRNRWALSREELELPF